MTINDIERMAAGQERVAAYRSYVEENPNHPALSPELYLRLPARVRDLIGDGGQPWHRIARSADTGSPP